MSSRADELVRRFEARAGAAVEAEKAAGRIVCFTYVELLKGIAELSLARTLLLVKVPLADAEAIQADFEMVDGKLRPALSFKRDVVLPITPEHLASIFGQLFRAQCLDWDFEFEHAKKDIEAFHKLHAWREAHPETEDAFAKRLKKWCG